MKTLAEFGIVDKDSEYKDRNKRLDKALSEGKDIREAEANIYKTDKIQKVKMKGDIDSHLKRVTFYFNSDEEIALIKNTFKVLEYNGYNVSDSSKLIEMIKTSMLADIIQKKGFECSCEKDGKEDEGSKE